METDSSFYYGSLDVTEILDALKSGHSAFTKAKTKRGDRVFMNARMWVNKEPNTVGNHASLIINSAEKAPAAEREKKLYFGNFKYSEKGSGAPVEAGEAAAMATETQKAIDNLPF